MLEEQRRLSHMQIDRLRVGQDDPLQSKSGILPFKFHDTRSEGYRSFYLYEKLGRAPDVARLVWHTQSFLHEFI